MTSQQVIFRDFVVNFHPATLNLKKIPLIQLIKKFWPYWLSIVWAENTLFEQAKQGCKDSEL